MLCDIANLELESGLCTNPSLRSERQKWIITVMRQLVRTAIITATGLPSLYRC